MASARSALVARSRARRGVGVPTLPAEPPDGVALALASLADARLRKWLVQYTQALWRLKQRGDAGLPVFKSLDELDVYFAELFVRDFASVLGSLLSGVTDFNRASQKLVWQRALGIDPPTESARYKAVLEAARKRNVALIKTVGETAKARVFETLNANVGDPTPALSRKLQRDISVSASRARLWARDQTLKLNGELTRATHEEAGVEEYEWVTSADERVRESHRRLNGVRFKWDDPPVVSDDGRHEHPGGDYQCRCIANPVINLSSL